MVNVLAVYVAFHKNYEFMYLLLSGHGGRIPISATRVVLMYLWFAGHQCCYRDVADRFNVQLNTLYNVITRVSQFLIEMSAEVIKFPSDHQKYVTSQHFLNKTRFPNVIGAIDGSHIRLNKPKHDPVSYINRKRYYSIQLQGICDEHGRFLDVFVGYPGSCHDARVFGESDVNRVMDELCSGNYLILGDSTYPLSKNIMVPFKDNGHLSAPQRLFNLQLSKCRIIIEHAFGRLKQRFRQLYHLQLKNIQRIVMCIHALCVLHNLGTEVELDIFRMTELQIDDQQPDPNIEEEVAHNNNVADENAGGQHLRNRIVALLNM